MKKAVTSVVSYVLLASVVLGTFSGCGNNQSDQPQPVPGVDTPTTVDQLPYANVLDFYKPLDPNLVIDEATRISNIALLEQARQSFELQLLQLNQKGDDSSTQAVELRTKIEQVNKRIQELISLPASRIITSGSDSAQFKTVAVTGQPDVQLPAELEQGLRATLSDAELKALLNDLRLFSLNQMIDRRGANATKDEKLNKFDGFIKSYSGPTDHQDHKSLVRYGRVVPYDQAISIYADLVEGDYGTARRKVEALFKIMEYESASGLQGVIRFGYNTTDDLFESPLAPLGNTSWALKSIFAYVDITGDRSVLTGNKGAVLNKAMQFILSQQVMDQNDPRYGLFRAGTKTERRGGVTVETQNEFVVFEHLADMHDLLNLAYRVTGNPVFKERRILLDNQTLKTLLVDQGDTQGAYFRPNINPDGTFGKGIAIDDLTWAGSMVLTMEHVPLERRMELARRLITHVRNNFVVEQDISNMKQPAPAQAVVMNQSLINERTSTPRPKSVIGVKFFDGVFGDEFIQEMNWDDPSVMSVQFEATLGYVHLLFQTAALSNNAQERAQLMREARFLLDNIVKYHKLNSQDKGLAYSTRNISEVQTTLESIIATDTYRTILGIWANPRLMWTFLGATESSLQGTRNVLVKTDGTQPLVTDPMQEIRQQMGLRQGLFSDATGTPQTAPVVTPQLTPQGLVPPVVSGLSTFVIDAKTGQVVHPPTKYGTSAIGSAETPSVGTVMRDDFRSVLRFLQNATDLVSFGVDDIDSWKGSFYTPSAWTVNRSALQGFTPVQGKEYTASIVNGELVVLNDTAVPLQKIRQLAPVSAGDRFTVSISGNNITIRSTLSGTEYDRYGDFSGTTKGIYSDKGAPFVLSLSDYPELASLPKNVTLNARIGADRKSLMITQQSPLLQASVQSVLGTSFYAPDGVQFKIMANPDGTVRITEQTDVASLHQNPWTPNITPKDFPIMFQALRAKGVSALYVNTEPLVLSSTVQGMDSRQYYYQLIEAARREGIKVYAIQGHPDWVTQSGASTASLYIDELGKKQLDFDGYILDVQPDNLPQWISGSAELRAKFSTAHVQIIKTLTEKINYYAGERIPVMSYQSSSVLTEGVPQLPTNSDVLVIRATTSEEILKQVRAMNPDKTFRIYIEGGMQKDPKKTFLFREQDMKSVLQEVTLALRSDVQFGRNFAGFVVNQDTGEDLLHLLRNGTGRDMQARIKDSFYRAPDGAIYLVSNLYNMLVAGAKPELLHKGQTDPTQGHEVVQTLNARLEALARGISGAGNIDHMIRSVVETIHRDRPTILSDSPPLGAEIGSLVSLLNIIWGEQYTDIGSITGVEIIGRDANGKIVKRWTDIVNNPVPIVVSQQSNIARLEVKATVSASTDTKDIFPAYIGFLTHHPGSGGVVTEASSDEFTLKPGESTSVSFNVEVTRQGFSGFSLVLFNGKKFSSATKVVDMAGSFGHRWNLLAEWIRGHADSFPQFYLDATSKDTGLKVNEAGIYASTVTTQIAIQDFTITDFSRERGETLAGLLSSSGVSSLVLDGSKIAELINTSKDRQGAQTSVSEFVNALGRSGIKVHMMIGNKTWLDDTSPYLVLKRDLNTMFGLKIPYSGVVINLDLDPNGLLYKEISTLVKNEGFAEPVLYQPTVYQSSAGPTSALGSRADLLKNLRSGADRLLLTGTTIDEVKTVLSQLGNPSPADLQGLAQIVTEDDLKDFIKTGYPNLSRIEKLLFNFASIKRLPLVQLGEVASDVKMVTPANIYQPADGTPYVSVNVEHVGNADVGHFNAVVELSNTYTGERKTVSFPVLLKKGEKRIVNIPIENLEPGQWRYDVSFVPDYYERLPSYIHSMPLAPSGTSVKVGQFDFTTYAQQRDIGERTVTVAGVDFQLIERYGPDNRPAVRFYDEAGKPVIMALDDLRKGVSYGLGPSKIFVNVSKTIFNEWAVEVGGEEVTIGQYRDGREVLSIGIPHKARVFGFIQKGLPKITVSDVKITSDDQFIDSHQSQIVPIQLSTPVTVDGYTVLFNKTLLEDIFELVVTGTDGQITRRTFHKNNPMRSVVLGNKLLIFGTNSKNQTVGVISDFVRANVSFSVSNTGTSLLRYQPEIAFQHPLVGEISIPSEEHVTIHPGQSHTTTATFPIPVDVLAVDKMQMDSLLTRTQKIADSYSRFLTEGRIKVDSGELLQKDYAAQIQTRQQAFMTDITAVLNELSTLVTAIQSKNLTQELALEGTVSLAQRKIQITDVVNRIQRAQPSDFDRLYIDAVQVVTSVKRDLGDLSTQELGYRLSILDLANMLGEPVFLLGPGGENMGPLVREVVIDPVMNKTMPQQIRRVAKVEPFIIEGVFSEKDVFQRLTDIQGAELNYSTGFSQLFFLNQELHRVRSADIPTAELAAKIAQENIGILQHDLKYARTVKRADMYTAFATELTAVQPEDPAHIIETMVIVEKAVGDLSHNIIARFLMGDQKTFLTSMPVTTQSMQQLFQRIAGSSSMAEVDGHIETFMKGQDKAEIERVKQSVHRIVTSDSQIKEKALAMTVVVLDEMNLKNDFALESIAKLRQFYTNDRDILPNLIAHLKKYKGQSLSWSEMNSIIKSYAAQHGKQYEYYGTYVGQNIDETIRYMEMNHNRSRMRLFALGVMEERIKADEISRNVNALGTATDDQIRQAQTAYQRAAAYYFQLIGVNRDFEIITDFNTMISRVEASSLPRADKDRVIDRIKKHRSDYAQYLDYISVREAELTTAQQQVKVRQQAVTDAKALLAKLEAVQKTHTEYVADLNTFRNDSWQKYQDAIRALPAPKAIEFINKVYGVYGDILRTEVTDAQQALIAKQMITREMEQNRKRVAELNDQYYKEPVAARRQIILTEIRDLKEKIYQAESQLAFYAWYIPQITDRVKATQQRLSQLQGAARDLGGRIDPSQWQTVMDTAAKFIADERGGSAAFVDTYDKLAAGRNALMSDMRSLTKGYAYPLTTDEVLQDMENTLPVFSRQLQTQIRLMSKQIDQASGVITRQDDAGTAYSTLAQEIMKDAQFRQVVSVPDGSTVKLTSVSVSQFDAAGFTQRLQDLAGRLRQAKTYQQAQAISSELSALNKEFQDYFVRLQKTAEDKAPTLTFEFQIVSKGKVVTTVTTSITQRTDIGRVTGYAVSVKPAGKQAINLTGTGVMGSTAPVYQGIADFRMSTLLLEDWITQTKENADDISIISQGLTLEIKKRAPISPITVTIPQNTRIFVDGKWKDIPKGSYTIKGTFVEAMEELDALIDALEEPAGTARIRVAALDSLRAALQKAHSEIPVVPAGKTFLADPAAEKITMKTAVKNAEENVAIAEALLKQSTSSFEVAKWAVEQAEAGITQASADLTSAETALTTAKDKVTKARRDSLKEFSEMFELLTGNDYSAYVASHADENQFRVTLNTAHLGPQNKALLDTLKKMALPPVDLKQRYSVYGEPISFNYSDLSLGSVTRSYLSLDIALSGGLYTIKWHPTEPGRIDIFMSYTIDTKGFEMDRYNNQRRHFLTMLRNIASREQFVVLGSKVEQVSKSIDEYRDAVSWLQYLEINVRNAQENKVRAELNLARARQFLTTQQFSLIRQREALNSRQRELTIAQSILQRVQVEANDTVTDDELLGSFRPQQQYTVADDEGDLAKKSDLLSDSDKGLDSMQKRDAVFAKLFARIIYGIVGLIFTLFKLDSAKKLLNKKDIREEQEKDRQAEQARTGLLKKLVKYLSLDSVTVSEIVPFSGRRELNLARNKRQFTRAGRLMKRWGVDTFAVVGDAMKEKGKFIDEDVLSYKDLFAKERYEGMTRIEKWTYQSRLFFRLFRGSVDDTLASKKFKRVWLGLSLAAGIFVLPFVPLPAFGLLGGLASTITMPWFVWAPLMYILPRTLYNVTVLSMAAFGVAKLLVFIAFSLFKWAFTKALYAVFLPVMPFLVLGQKIITAVTGLKFNVADVQNLPSFIVGLGGKIYRTLRAPLRNQTPAGKDFSIDFSQRVLEKARSWVRDNGLGELENLPAAEAQKIINSFVVEETIKTTKHVVFQDEGNSLRVNIGSAVDDLRLSPGIFANMPAIYVPFFLPTKAHFNKWFWGIMIQNVTQSLQYAASMGARALRGAERGAIAKHAVFSHIVSKSELDIHSFLFMVQPRWLVGHLHVIREELLGGRIVIDLAFNDARELENKQAPEGVQQWDNLEDYVNYLIENNAELPELNEEALHQIFTGNFPIEFNFPAEMSEEQRQAFRDHVTAQFDQLVQLAAGYYRAYPDEFNPFYGPGENVTFSGHFPDVSLLDDGDRGALGTYEPTEGIFYVRGNYFGGLNYAPGGIVVKEKDGKLEFVPTGEPVRVEYQQKEEHGKGPSKIPGTKATNLNAIMLAIQGQTYLSRRVEPQPDGTKKVFIEFRDAHQDHLPEVQTAKEEFEEQNEQRGQRFRRGWWKVAKKLFVNIFDETTGQYVSVNLNTKLGFEPFAGFKGFLARWKTLTVGAVLGVLPVSLYGWLQDPINAAMQAAYSPALVKKASEYEMYTNAQVYSAIGTEVSDIERILNNARFKLGDVSLRFPDESELQSPEGREAFAAMLYDIARNVDIHMPRELFIANADILLDTHRSILDFLIAVELSRLRERREQNNSFITSWEKGLTEYGAALMNVQEYLHKIGTVFPQNSNQQKALRYLAAIPGMSDEQISFDVQGETEPRAFDLRTAYRIGVYNRTSQNYMAAYNHIAGMTYHGSHDDNVHRSGALEAQLGDRGREPILRLGQERNELQGTRSWAKISPKGPLAIFQMKTMAKRLRNVDSTNPAAVFMRELVDVANRNGTPIDRIIIHDGRGNAPSSNPAEWHIIVVSDSQTFLATPDALRPLLRKALESPQLSGLAVNEKAIQVIHREGLNTLAKFNALTGNGYELEAYNEITERMRSAASARVGKWIHGIRILFGVDNEQEIGKVMEPVSKLAGKQAQADPLIAGLKASYAKKKSFLNTIRSFITISESNLFDKLITVPLMFIIKNSLPLGLAALALVGPGALFAMLSGLVLAPFSMPLVLSVAGIAGFAGAVLAAAYVVSLPVVLIASIYNYSLNYGIFRQTRELKKILVDESFGAVSMKGLYAVLNQKKWEAYKAGMDAVINRTAGIEDVGPNDISPVRSIVNGFRTDSALIHEAKDETAQQAELVRAALENGFTIEPSTVEEEYLASTRPDDTGVEESFQEFSYNHTEIEPAVEEVSAELARRGSLLLDNLRRAAAENPQELMTAINAYIAQRRQLEAQAGYEDRFEDVTLEDIQALYHVSQELKRSGYMNVRSETGRNDIKVLGKIFGLNYEDAMDMLSSYWSEAQWPVAVGIPFMPGTTKGRFRVATRGANLEDARPIPLLSAMMTFAEPPWLAGLSAFNILDTEADDPAFALAEDTKFGIMGVYNPPLYPNTPAISIHLKKYIEEQYERRLFGESSYKTAAQVGKGFSVLHGIDSLFTHPIFTVGTNAEVRDDWREVMDTVFNAKANKRDEISYEGAGRGSGWLNYIIFGYSLYGHLAKRVGAFPPGVAQAMRQVQYIKTLDEEMDGRLLQVIRYLQITAPTPVFNGLAGVDFRLAVSIAKGLEKVNVEGKDSSQVLNELIQQAIAEVVARKDTAGRRKAYDEFMQGNRLFGHDLPYPEQYIPEAEPEQQKEAAELTEDETHVINELRSLGYSQSDIEDIIANIANLDPAVRLAALKNIQQATVTPARGMGKAREVLWKFRFNKAIPEKILQKRIIRTKLGSVLNFVMIAGSIALWGWWAMAIPMLFFIVDTIGIFKGYRLKNVIRPIVGALGVIGTASFLPAFGFIGLAPLALFYIYLFGGEKAAEYLLNAIDRVPIAFMRAAQEQYNKNSLVEKMRFLGMEDSFNPALKREIIKETVALIGERAQSEAEYNNMFREKFVLTTLENSYLTKLRQYYQQTYGDRAEEMEQAMLDSLSKFAVDQRLRIVKHIYSRLSKSFTTAELNLYLLTRSKTGEKMEYKSRIGKLRDYFTSRGKERLLGGIAASILLTTAFILFGFSLSPLGFIGVGALTGVLFIIGTKTSEQTLGALTATMLPLLHIGLFGLAASFMPIVVILAEMVVGYMAGSTAGLILKHSVELWHNLITAPYKRILNLSNERTALLSKNPAVQRRLMLESVVNLVDESDSDLEFRSKFDRLFLDTIETVSDDAVDSDGGQIPQSTPPAPPAAPGGETPDGIVPTPEKPSDDGGFMNRMQSAGSFMARQLGFNPFESDIAVRAVNSLTRGISVEQAKANVADIIESTDWGQNRLTLSQLISINRMKKFDLRDQLRRGDISEQEFKNRMESIAKNEKSLLQIVNTIAARADKGYFESLDSVAFTREGLFSALRNIRNEMIADIRAQQLTQEAETIQISYTERQFEVYINIMNELFYYHNYRFNESMNGLMYLLLALESSSSLMREPNGLIPALQKAEEDGILPREIYNSVIEVVFGKKSRLFTSFLASARTNTTIAGADQGLVDYIIEQEIVPNRHRFIPEEINGLEGSTVVAEQSVPAQASLPKDYVTGDISVFFEQFNPDVDGDRLVEYLAEYSQDRNIPKPAAEAISRNPLLRSIPRAAEPSVIFGAVHNVAKKASLNLNATLQLIRLLEETGYILSFVNGKDMIVLDFDAFDLVADENRGNQNQKQMLTQYIDALKLRYEQFGREARIMVFSEQLDSCEIQARLGETLRTRIDLIFGKEMFIDFGLAGSQERFVQFFADRIMNQNVNRLNIKLFTNKRDISQTASHVGTLVVSPNVTVFDALKIFANVHPGVETVNIMSGNDTLADSFARPGNYLLLGGKELSIRGTREAAPRRNLNFRSFIDQAA